MNEFSGETDSAVIVHRRRGMMSLVLNRPHALNSINLKMIRSMQKALNEAVADGRFQFVLLYGAGNRGFSAGGDIMALAQGMLKDASLRPDVILEEEYDLCLRLHRFPKPVIVLADGITMGAGLGLTAGADIAVATERTRMAMPETRIGFFPDVGATGWMFTKCPKGYPEYLGLTGYEVVGPEAVRVGFATHLMRAERLPELIGVLEKYSEKLPQQRDRAAKRLASELQHLWERNTIPKSDMDEWVATYFADQTSLAELMESLRQCGIQSELCDGVFHRLAERSPTAVTLTLKLLRHNEGRPLEEVFQADLKAARFILSHPDFVEGVRARLLDKDDNPRWQPRTIEEVRALDLVL